MTRSFNLPPRAANASQILPEDASEFELLRAEAVEALLPHEELAFPAVSAFPEGSSELSVAAQRYAATLAESLRPASGQILVLEGHAPLTNRLLAWSRADTLRSHLLSEHGFNPDRVEARAWMTELEGAAQDTVDARLITPAIAETPQNIGE